MSDCVILIFTARTQFRPGARWCRFFLLFGWGSRATCGACGFPAFMRSLYVPIGLFHIIPLECQNFRQRCVLLHPLLVSLLARTVPLPFRFTLFVMLD